MSQTLTDPSTPQTIGVASPMAETMPETIPETLSETLPGEERIAANTRADGDLDVTGDEALGAALSRKTLLRVRGLGRRSRAIGLRLRVGDIIVAVNGEVFHGNPGELSDRLFIQPADDEEYDDEPQGERVERHVVTISRGGVFFEVFTYGPLGGDLDFVLPEESREIIAQFETRPALKLDELKAFEVYRDINRHCSMFEQVESATATITPILWLLERRMWEPLMATLSIYGLTFAISPWVFILTYILTALYFRRGQLAFQRSYAMFHERHMWMFVVAPSAYEAQVTCRMLDPKCSFEFSLIPPPKKQRPKAA